jgi:O-acetyl-ADP-ribose deacetylase
MAELISQKPMPGGQTISLYQGDLTEEAVDAIVNAANSALQHGAGVAGAIVRKGGQVIQEESDRIGRVWVGNVAMTGAGSLPAKHVIHAVGPKMGEGDESRKLSSAVRNALELAEDKGFRSIAFPAISSGIFGFPKDACARILVGEAEQFCEEHPHSHLRDIRFTLIDDETVAFFRKEFERRWGPQGDRVTG